MLRDRCVTTAGNRPQRQRTASLKDITRKIKRYLPGSGHDATILCSSTVASVVPSRSLFAEQRTVANRIYWELAHLGLLTVSCLRQPVSSTQLLKLDTLLGFRWLVQCMRWPNWLRRQARLCVLGWRDPLPVEIVKRVENIVTARLMTAKPFQVVAPSCTSGSIGHHDLRSMQLTLFER